jgi:RNA polymerase sigma factor (sigma-70 family)
MNWFEVMHRFENEDPKAYHELSTLIHQKLALMRPRCFERTDDIVQDTLICLLRAWRRGAILDENGFEGFVWTLAKRRSADAWHRHIRPGAPDCMGDPELAADPEAALVAEERRECAFDLTRALERIDGAHRRALEAVYVRGQTYMEAAAGLGLPLGTFKRRLGDGLRRMRAELECWHPAVHPDTD